MKTNIFLIIILTTLLVSISFAAAYGGGTGTSTDPYQIWTPQQLNTVGTDSNDWNNCFKLMADVNMAAYTGMQYNIIGNSATNFTGKFDGNNHIIRNFTYCSTMTDNVGLFGYTGNAAEIKNLGLEDVNVVGNSNIGGLAGSNNGAITSCYADGKVAGYSYVGGLAGNNNGSVTFCYAVSSVSGTDESSYDVGGLAGGNSGTITSCHATGSVTVAEEGGYDAGGLVGYNNYGTITSSYAAGSVTGYFNVGGLVGENYNSTLTSCYATGSVTGKNYVGGLAGSNWLDFGISNITFCYATGSVSGNYLVGGLAGSNDYSTLASCYATGSISGNNIIGGLVGRNFQGKVIRCYSTGKPTGVSNVGGLCGSKSTGGDYEDTGNFWDKQTSQIETSVMGTKKTTVEMMTESTFTSAGWDFLETWGITENVSYPYLLSYESKYGGGTGDPNTPYLIYTPEQMNTIGTEPNDWNKCFKLMSDIDMSAYTGTQYNIIGTDWNKPFTGKFDGNNHKIINLSYSDTTKDFVGLFGWTDPGAEIKNLGVEDANIAGMYYVGGLIGRNDGGTLHNCYVIGDVDANSDVGGMIGYNDGEVNNCYSIVYVNGIDKNTGGSSVGGLIGSNDGTVNGCFSAGNISGTGNFVGGLVGRNIRGVVESCYSTSSVNGSSSVGGLIGDNAKSIVANCYATGNVSGGDDVGGLIGSGDYNVSNCYSTGDVSGYSNVGGLIGYNNKVTITACFWDVNTSGTINGVGNINPDPNGVIGKTTAEMMMQSTFTSAGWDFVGETVNGPNDFWRMCVDGVSYPKFKWQFAKTDYICPDGVNFLDYAVFAIYWLKDGNSDSRLDLTDDRLINFNDFAVIAGLWQVTGCGDCNGADYSKDGDIDEDDLVILGQNWLRTDYGDVDGIDLTGDGKVDYEELKIFAEEWLK